MFRSRRPDIRYSDLHCHILPGLDDGAQDTKTALQMARIARESGAKRIFATPHILPGVFDPSVQEIRRGVTELQDLIDREGIDLTLLEGSEISLSERLEPDVRDERVLPLAGSRHLLIELPSMSSPANSLDRIFDLRVLGVGVILAHPERSRVVRENRGLVKEMVETGVYLQVNAGSLVGVYGREVARFAIDLVREDLVHFVGSDAHSGRSPDLRDSGPDILPALDRVFRTASERERFMKDVEERVDELISDRLH